MNNFERIYNLVEDVYLERYPKPETFWASVRYDIQAALRRSSIASQILPAEERALYFRGMQARESLEATIKKEHEQAREQAIDEDIEDFWRASL